MTISVSSRILEIAEGLPTIHPRSLTWVCMQRQFGAVPKGENPSEIAISIKSTETIAGILGLHRWETFYEFC